MMTATGDRDRDRVGIITHNVDKGGVQRVAIAETRLLGERGYDTTLCSVVAPTDPWEELLDGVDLEFSVGTPGSTVAELVSRGVGSFRRMGTDTDLNVCHNLPGLQVGYREWKKRGTPYVAYMHDAGIYPIAGSPVQQLFSAEGTGSFGAAAQRVASTLEYRWLDAADTIFVNSKATKEELRSEYGFETEYLFPTTIPDLRSSQRPREGFFLVVQRLGSHPTYDLLDELLEREPDLEVVVAGKKKSDLLFRNVRSRFKSHGDRVRFVPNPSDAKLEELYNRALGYLQPGHENFNMSALEAASVGCPILVPAASGIAELFEDYPLVCESGEIGEFAQTARSLIDDRAYAEEMGERARSTAEEWDGEYHVETLASAIE